MTGIIIQQMLFIESYYEYVLCLIYGEEYIQMLI
jgi:hypothetical protein